MSHLGVSFMLVMILIGSDICPVLTHSWAEYNNNYCFNLFGDPSLRREGIAGGFPSKPEINGPSSGITNTDYDYTFSSIDPTDEDVYYYIEWGDGSSEEWIGPCTSGEEVKKTHSWSEKGTFFVRAKAKDLNDGESDWTILEVSMPINKPINDFNPWILRLIQRFPILKSLL